MASKKGNKPLRKSPLQRASAQSREDAIKKKALRGLGVVLETPPALR
jgi:hypothetical protein